MPGPNQGKNDGASFFSLLLEHGVKAVTTVCAVVFVVIAFLDSKSSEVQVWCEVERPPVVREGNIAAPGFRRYYVVNLGPPDLNDISLKLEVQGECPEGVSTLPVRVKASSHGDINFKVNSDCCCYTITAINNLLQAGRFFWVDLECYAAEWPPVQITPHSKVHRELQLSEHRPSFKTHQSYGVYFAGTALFLVLIAVDVLRTRWWKSRLKEVTTFATAEGFGKAEQTRLDTSNAMIKDGDRNSDQFEDLLKPPENPQPT